MSYSLKPWETLSQLINTENRSEVAKFIDDLSTSETARAISRLSEEEQQALFTILSPEDAADVIEDISETQAAGVVENLPSEQAAAIMEELDSDHLVDVLGEMDSDASESILSQMEPDDAEEARTLLNYPPDSAGGLMISEFLAFQVDDTIQDVQNDLQENQTRYRNYNVQYFFVVETDKRLAGVLRVHDLLFPARQTRLSDIMIRSPLCVSDQASLAELEIFFDEHKLLGVPVVDNDRHLVGLVLPRFVEEAISKQKTKTFLRLSGIIGGEEFRTMPLAVRSGRRLSWLSMNIVLNIIAASVIAFYQDTLAAVIALAVFLPMVSDMSGRPWRSPCVSCLLAWSNPGKSCG